MRKYNNNNNIIDIIITIILVVVAMLVGYRAGQHGLELDAYERGRDNGYDVGYDEGWDAGVKRGQYYIQRELYAICEDHEIAEQYPSGFCEGVDAYLNL